MKDKMNYITIKHRVLIFITWMIGIILIFGITAPAYAKTARPSVKMITLNTGTRVLKKGKKAKLKAIIHGDRYKKKKVIWYTNRKKIATVSSKGTVKARKKGTAIITARIKDTKYTAKCKIIVGVPVKKIIIPTDKISLKVGDTSTLRATVSPAKASVKEISFVSSDKTVVSVSPKGVIRAKTPGNAVIQVTSKDGNRITGKVHVTVDRKGSSSDPNPVSPGETGTPENPGDNNPEETTGNPEGGETEESVSNVDRFMSLMEEYSIFIRENGDLFYKEKTPTIMTYAAAKNNVERGVSSGINCASPINWALRTMGLSSAGQVYGSSKGFVITNTKTKAILEEKAVFLDKALAVGMNVQRASDRGYIKYGDILSMVIDESTSHTAVYYGRSEDGHALVYEAGRIPYELGYTSYGCGPLDYSNCTNYVITEIMRLK